MSSDDTELVWSLLGLGKFEALKSSIPENFSWEILHPRSNVTLLVAACTPQAIIQDDEILDVIEWLVRSGANPSQRCGRSWAEWVDGRCDRNSWPTKIATQGHSLLSFIQAYRDELDKDGPCQICTSRIDFLDKVVERVAKGLHQRKGPRRRASVHEGIVDIWEKSLLATASHDLSIETADGEVTAHAHMLIGASPVVQAMLGSTMKEGKSRRIQVPDTGSGAVTLFLEALYTSSALSDPDYKTALSALDLAHRWQVEVVVSMLSDLVKEMITEESFQEIAEHAVLKNLDTLKKACQRFGTDCVEIQDKINKHQFPKAVQDLFQGHSEAPPPVKKRRSL